MRDTLEMCPWFTRLEHLTHLFIDNGFATYAPYDAVNEAEQYFTQRR